MQVEITNEMVNQASIEAKRRNPYIQHHFEVEHLTPEQRDIIGFLGEFACCMLFNINWKNNIRENYFTIDDFDFKVKGLKVDVKTETVPFSYIDRILNKNIDDNRAYGRRLINQGQFNLLTKYDIVIFGLFDRDNFNIWYPIGYLETKEIISKYPPTLNKPYGGTYPFSASPVPTSILKPITDLIN